MDDDPNPDVWTRNRTISTTTKAMLSIASSSETGGNHPVMLNVEAVETRVVPGRIIPSETQGRSPGLQTHSGSGEKLARKVRWFVYLSHSLSAWGDRMWLFGVGLFLVVISPESLRLIAIYGFSSGGAILLFGPLVGDWVDNTPRLTAARVTLVIQNLCVVLSAGTVFCVLWFQQQIKHALPDEALLDVCYVIIIVITILSNIASMGSKIAVERDWIVNICGKDRDMLASMTASLRRIDQVALILAPVATGQIMTYASTGIGALFIAGWNLVSVFVEYNLLSKVYDMVPGLRDKKYRKRVDRDVVSGKAKENGDVILENIGEGYTNEILSMPDETAKKFEKDNRSVKTSPKDEVEVEHVANSSAPRCCPSVGGCMLKMFSGIFTLIRGWKTYMQYDVAFAGLGLAMLYMTVLGFDNITVGFAYTQGLTESILGVLMAGGALAGILGTILYPIIRRKVGLERTGLFGFFFELSFLCLCLASVWSPGSPFDPLNWQQETADVVQVCNGDPVSNTTMPPTGIGFNITVTPIYQAYIDDSTIITTERSTAVDVSPEANATVAYGYTIPMANSIFNVTANSTAVNGVCEESKSPSSYISIALLLAGIIGARCGLWMADLTITQLFLEAVDERERGIVNGVQGSLNQLMDMLKFLMVIVAPQPKVFGVLVIISFGFVSLGWLFYAWFSRKARGHLFHLEKCKCGVRENNNVPPVDIVTKF